MPCVGEGASNNDSLMLQAPYVYVLHHASLISHVFLCFWLLMTMNFDQILLLIDVCSSIWMYSKGMRFCIYVHNCMHFPACVLDLGQSVDFK